MSDIRVNEEAPFSAVAIFAETVCEERAGVLSLINIFPDTILLERLPATLPTLHAYIRISYNPADPPRTVSAGSPIVRSSAASAGNTFGTSTVTGGGHGASGFGSASQQLGDYGARASLSVRF